MKSAQDFANEAEIYLFGEHKQRLRKILSEYYIFKSEILPMLHDAVRLAGGQIDKYQKDRFYLEVGNTNLQIEIVWEPRFVELVCTLNEIGYGEVDITDVKITTPILKKVIDRPISKFLDCFEKRLNYSA